MARAAISSSTRKSSPTSSSISITSWRRAATPASFFASVISPTPFAPASKSPLTTRPVAGSAIRVPSTAWSHPRSNAQKPARRVEPHDDHGPGPRDHRRLERLAGLVHQPRRVDDPGQTPRRLESQFKKRRRRQPRTNRLCRLPGPEGELLVQPGPPEEALARRCLEPGYDRQEGRAEPQFAARACTPSRMSRQPASSDTLIPGSNACAPAGWQEAVLDERRPHRPALGYRHRPRAPPVLASRRPFALQRCCRTADGPSPAATTGSSVSGTSNPAG